MLTAVLAHQGGWDEILFVVVPLVVFFLLLRLAKKRADEQYGERDAESPLDALGARLPESGRDDEA